jgi:phosphatidylserine/phosphatidylglycerophosphate/cardiolipin synthase-like enzyme
LLAILQGNPGRATPVFASVATLAVLAILRFPCYQNIMHEKFCVIDLYTSIHGTFNWTKAANFNKEHISIDKNHSTAAAFADEFMKLKNKKVWNT